MNDNTRIFSFFDNTALWFSLGTGLLVMQMGSFLHGGIFGLNAVLAISIGSIIGAMILGLVAAKGQESGLNSAQLMTQTMGKSLAALPIILNILQLMGWTAFEFVIMSEGLMAILSQKLALKIDPIAAKMVFAVIFSGLMIYLLSKPMVGIVRKIVSRIALPLVVLSLLWLSIQFAQKINISEIFTAKKTGEMGLFAAIDLVIAMPISWLPLVCDYSRFSKTKKSAFGGTFAGYVIANIWCYALGFMIAAAPQQSESFVATILLAQGGLIALGLILFDEFDNAYGDSYSASVSISSLLPQLGEKNGGKIIVAISGAAAAFLPMHGLEPFLILLSSIFIPLFGVILGASFKDAKFNFANLLIWVLGIITYHSILKFAPQIGASIPSFVFAFVLTKGVGELQKRHAYTKSREK